MADLSTLIALSERVRAATGPDRGINLAIAKALVPDVVVLRYDSNINKNIEHTYWQYTSKIDDAVALLNRVLPGWWWRVGTCCVSDDACIAPDYNDPEHGDRLRREFPLPAERNFEEPDGRMSYGPFDGGFDIDRRPAGNLPLALLEAMLDALIYIEEMRLKSEVE
jgi:hypothetical protein